MRRSNGNRTMTRPATTESLLSLYEKGLKDIYWAEKHLVKALPKLAKAAASEELRTAFESHLDQTEEHVSRLEKVFAASGLKAAAKKCEGIEGLTSEADETIEGHNKGNVRDAGLIIAAQKVEHYEMAAYGSLRSLAEVLGFDKAADVLQSTLGEEREADELLSTLAGSINEQANAGTADSEEPGGFAYRE